MPPHVAVRHRFLTQREVRLIRRFLGEPWSEQPQLSTHKNNCYNTSTTAIIKHLQRPFLQNPAELTTLNDVGPSAIS